MREIDENIKKVLRNAVKKQGSVLQLSRILGVSHSTILFWLNGKIKNISTDIWCRKLYPVLEEELVCHFSDMSVGEIRQKYCGGTDEAEDGVVLSVPLLKEQDLLRFELPFENMERYACQNSISRVMYEGKAGHKYYAVFLAHTTDSFGHLPGSVVFFREHDYLLDDCVVLAKMYGRKELTLCRYLRQNTYVSLLELHTGQKIDSWSLGEGYSVLEWLFPVVNVRISCRENPFESELDEKRPKKTRVSA